MNKIYDEDSINDIISTAKNTQWHHVGNFYFKAKPTVASLPPGYYEAINVFGEIHFMKIEVAVDGIFPTGSLNAKEIIKDIDTFWDSAKIFEEYEVPYKRGIFLSGPPGSGKTCIIKLLSNSTLERGGIMIDVRGNVYNIGPAIRDVREIHPTIPIIIVLEDIDRWLDDPSPLLNIMDGIEKVNKVLFIATANDTSDLDDAIMNRPGRFDVHYKILPPTSNVREAFIRRVLRSKVDSFDVPKLVEDTQDLPFGHIKELIVSVIVFKKDYEKTLIRLKSMREGEEEEEYEEEELEECCCEDVCNCDL